MKELPVPLEFETQQNKFYEISSPEGFHNPQWLIALLAMPLAMALPSVSSFPSLER